eukprot:11178697-Lingulodinium_polyedra.AAC.1
MWRDCYTHPTRIQKTDHAIRGKRAPRDARGCRAKISNARAHQQLRRKHGWAGERHPVEQR